MKRRTSAVTERVAVTQTQLAVEDGLRWVFREETVSDFGIDAQVEVVDEDEQVRGRLLALQIKGGESEFREPGPGGWWYRPDPDHLEYWLAHSLPVVLVLYHPRTRRCHWQLVRRETLTRTATGTWKLLVPEDHVLDETAKAALREAAEGGADALRAQLGFHRGRPPNRRTFVLGGLAALASAAVAAPLVLSRTGHSGPAPAAAPVSVAAYRILFNKIGVEATVFSPDGTTLASCGSNGVIRLWNTTSWTTTTVLRASRNTSVIAYSPHGRLLASADSSSPIVTLWDLITRRPTDLPGQVMNVFSVAFSPDGRTVATGSPYDYVETWDVASRTRTAKIFTDSSVNSMAFNHNGDVVALGCDDGTVQLWNLPAGQKIANMPNHPVHVPVESVAYSTDGKMLACGSDDRTVRLWNTDDNSLVAILRGHAQGVRSVAFSPDGRTLASGSNDTTIRIWDLTTHDTIAILRGHTSLIESLTFNPAGTTLASGSSDGTIRLWKPPRR